MFSYLFLSVKVDYNAVLPLQLLDADPARWHLGSPDTDVGWPHQHDGYPTLGLATRPRVGFIQLLVVLDVETVLK